MINTIFKLKNRLYAIFQVIHNNFCQYCTK